MAVRPSRAAGVIAGVAALAGLAAVPAFAASSTVAQPDGGRAVVAGSTPAWATPAAKIGQADGTTRRTVEVALGLRDERGAEALASAVSTPGSREFHHYLTAGEFNARFAPTQQTVDQVSAWLRSQGLDVTGVSSNNHFVDATGTNASLQAAFGTQLGVYKNITRGVTRDLVAPESAISLPVSLTGAVTAVVGLDDSAKTISPMHVLNVPNTAGPDASGPQHCSRFWGDQNDSDVPQKYPSGDQSNSVCGYNTAQVRGIYSLGGSNTGTGQDVGIVGAYNLDTIVSDTNRAAGDFGSPALTAGQYTTVPPAGGYVNDPSCGNPESWNSEQALDVQSIHTIAPAAKITYYAGASCTGLYDALNAAVSANQVSVISDSWGTPGESSVTAAERNQLQSITVQAAIQGQAVLFSSGDQGDNSGVDGAPQASFPASNPYVTAVGGTTVGVTSGNGVQFTTGWESAGNVQNGNSWQRLPANDGAFAGGAGGGVSQVYTAPDYQNGVVPASVAQGHRAIPDISMLADSYTGEGIGFTASGGYVEYSSGGTSLASPLLAGLTADAQQTQGIAREGFLNPSIYAQSGKAGLTDVTPHATGIWTPEMASFGNVPVPSTQGSFLIDNDAKPQSLQSAPGWDLVTGVGTPSSGFLSALGQ